MAAGTAARWKAVVREQIVKQEPVWHMGAVVGVPIVLHGSIHKPDLYAMMDTVRDVLNVYSLMILGARSGIIIQRNSWFAML